MLENDIPDPSRLTCEVDVVPAMVHTRLHDRCSPTPIWANGVDNDARTLYDCVDVINVRDIHYKYWNVCEVFALMYERLEL